jgi:hypothetical protein
LIGQNLQQTKYNNKSKNTQTFPNSTTIFLCL